MNNSEIEKIREIAFKGCLDAQSREQLKAFLDASPQSLSSDIKQDIKLGNLLRNVPQVPVSSNFTVRVMAEIESIESQGVITRQRPVVIDWLLYHIGYRVGATAVLLALIVFCHSSYVSSKNARLANKISELNGVAILDDKNSEIAVEIFKDFDIIQNLANQSTYVDTELLAALKAN